MTRDILNYLGEVVGTLTLPDETTEAQWTAALTPYAAPPAAPVIPAILKTYNLAESGSVTTSSSTPSTIGTLSEVPEAGTYVASFSGSVSTAGASAQGEFGIYVDDVLVAESKRPIQCNLQLLGGLVTISLNAIGVGTHSGAEVQLNGNQRIDVKFRSTNGGTIAFNERVLTLIKVR